YKDKYRLLTLTALDSLDNYFRSDPLYSRYISGFKNSLRGEKSLAVANYLEILPGLARQERLYDAAAAEVIDYYRNKPDYRQIYLRHLFDLARYYLDHGLIKTEVMAETGRVLIEEGYTELGKRCIRLALETSDMKIGPFRTFDRAEYSRYLTDNADSRSNAMAWLSIALLLLIVVLTVTCVLMYNRIKEISAQDNSAYSTLQARLASTRAMTADCFALMHTAAEQLREYNLLVVRKLTAGQSASLYADAESGKITRAASEKFFSELDSTIQKDFPDFTAGLNSLLQPDRQLLPDENGRFTPEMRIAALIHLGITDSSRLAGLLGLSLNTIYTYRNRLKGRALNRDTFETDLAEL
ncbi:MAG: hypothetical protein K2F63_06665, partial [Muribaculaceae bacterium]|nr:hypothetical protein [Muribaculaceae bacterium]